MKIDYESGRYFCFGCGASGNVLQLIQAIESKHNDNVLNDLQACFKMYEITHTDKTKHITNVVHTKQTKALPQYLIEAKHDYHGLLTNDWNDVTDEHTLQARQYMNDRGFDNNVLNKAKAKYTYNAHYPIMFPITENDVFKGYVCRTNLKHIEQKRKYLYNKGFSRETTLAGTYTSNKPVYIVEGYMDMLKMKMFGIKNVVAILGWKISQKQIQALKNAGVTKVISCLDNDTCGKKGTEYLTKFFSVIRFRFLKGIKDIGECNQIQFSKMLNKTKTDYKENKNYGINGQNQRRE